MNVFVDTNILLDVLAQREPFYAASAEIWTLAERREIRACVSAISFNNVYYVIRKAVNKAKANRAMRFIRDVFEIVAADNQIVNQAIDAEADDFEDAVQFHSAERAKARCLITRNLADYPKSGMPILTPVEFLITWHSLKRKP